MATLDKESQLERVLEGIGKLVADPSGQGLNQLKAIFTDDTMNALPISLGFRIPTEAGKTAAAKAAQVLDDIAVGREQMGLTAPHSAKDAVLGERVPRMPFLSAPELEGGRATSPSVDALYGTTFRPEFREHGENAVAEISKIRLGKALEHEGFEKLQRQQTLQALLELRRSLGNEWTGLTPKFK